MPPARQGPPRYDGPVGRRREGLEKGRRERIEAARSVEASRHARREASAAQKRTERRLAIEARQKTKPRRPKRAASEAPAFPGPLAARLAPVAIGIAVWSLLLLGLGWVFAPSPPVALALLVIVTIGVVLGAKRLVARPARPARPAAPAPEPRVRVEVEREPDERVAAPIVACAECDAPVEGDAASCALCVDVIHEGACAEQHEARHAGASGGRLYR